MPSNGVRVILDQKPITKSVTFSAWNQSLGLGFQKFVFVIWAVIEQFYTAKKRQRHLLTQKKVTMILSGSKMSRTPLFQLFSSLLGRMQTQNFVHNRLKLINPSKNNLECSEIVGNSGQKLQDRDRDFAFGHDFSISGRFLYRKAGLRLQSYLNPRTTIGIASRGLPGLPRCRGSKIKFVWMVYSVHLLNSQFSDHRMWNSLILCKSEILDNMICRICLRALPATVVGLILVYRGL